MVYGRVTVLVLVLMLFVGIWSSDQPDVRQEYAARHHGEIYVIGGRQPRFSIRRTDVDIAKTTVNRYCTPIRHVASTTTLQTTIPYVAIPGDLSTGTYRVVNNAGVVTTVTVTQEWLTHANIPTNLPAREFYIHQSSSECWYWIRLQPQTNSLATAGL